MGMKEEENIGLLICDVGSEGILPQRGPSDEPAKSRWLGLKTLVGHRNLQIEKLV
jgi:hypothetical protein